MGNDGVELLQCYLDHTGDIQSVCWLVVRCLEPALAVKSFEAEESVASRIQQWFVAYKELLDEWQMWTPRAHFDCAIQLAGMRCNAPQQVFISCTYCGTSVARNMKVGNLRNRLSFSLGYFQFLDRISFLARQGTPIVGGQRRCHGRQQPRPTRHLHLHEASHPQAGH